MLIKYIKSVLWRVGKCLSYIEEARCLKVKMLYLEIDDIRWVGTDVMWTCVGRTELVTVAVVTF